MEEKWKQVIASINKYMKKIFIVIIIFIIVLFSLNILSKNTNEKDIKSSNAKKISTNILYEDNSIENKNIALGNIIQEKQYLGIVEEEYKGYPVSAILEIPKIGLKDYVIEDYSVQALKVSIAKFWGGEPNEIGNFCIAGHNYKNFLNIAELTVGDEIILKDNYNGEISYVIYDIFTVLPQDTTCLSQKTEGKREVTLITCTKDIKQRIILKARESV